MLATLSVFPLDLVALGGALLKGEWIIHHFASDSLLNYLILLQEIRPVHQPLLLESPLFSFSAQGRSTVVVDYGDPTDGRPHTFTLERIEWIEVVVLGQVICREHEGDHPP